MSTTKADVKTEPYQVLARKYRSRNFDELIGQDPLVRTLKNAIESGRIAHAFMLTGIRGTGKTSTARIIAKALNYTGPDGKAGPTTGPTDDCKICQAISADRHPDVLEMDAASRTGVEDIREILDGVRYAPVEARYKVYIIDEVHMLSKQAFNALLKTLEEPPEHVKFIFATTEIRKVPVTVLSRCQRFDLRRIEAQKLIEHFTAICGKENVEAEEEAIRLIARAADGSARDGLSILDQAIALSGGKVTAQQVHDMLGLADRARSLDVLEHALSGNMPEALRVVEELHKNGADPLAVMQDLLDVTHLLTKLRALKGKGYEDQTMGDTELNRAKDMSGKLSMPTLSRTWQILLKGIDEVQRAPNPQNAAEMIVIRLAYAADLPDPLDLIKTIKKGGDLPSSGPSGSPPPSGLAVPAGAPAMMQGARSGSAQAALQTDLVPVTDPGAAPVAITCLEDVVDVLENAGDFLLGAQVRRFVHLVKLEKGRIEFYPAEDAPPKLAQDLGKCLSDLTAERWVVSITREMGKPTLAEKAQAERDALFAEVKAHPHVQEVLKVFPKAILVDIKQNPEE